MPSLPTSIAGQQHDHSHCIHTAMATAKTLCKQRGVRLTTLREQVLMLIWQNHHPLGAYDLMDRLAEFSTRRVAPPTVYRALDFLLEQRLIHRINSLNAFIGCTHPDHQHSNNFLICRDCGVAIEFNTQALAELLQATAATLGFSADSFSLEGLGQCSRCSTEAPTS